jgi:drug/metabolite transporter (DMT)-like permease
MLCLVAAVCYAAGVVCQKLALRHASAVQVTAFGCFTGTAACLPFAGQFLSQLGQAPASATLQVVYLGLFPTTLGFTTWAYALARTTSGKMGATTYAVPTLVIIMSWLILGQVPRWLAVAGGAVCLAGVAVSRSRSRADQKASGRLCDDRPNVHVGVGGEMSVRAGKCGDKRTVETATACWSGLSSLRCSTRL